MKKLKLAVGMLVIVMAAVLLPNTEVFAEKKQKVIQTKINTSGIKKMKNSDKKGEILEEAESATCYAWIQGKKYGYINSEIEHLYVTKDGKTIKTVNLKSIVEQALHPEENDVIRFYHLTCIEDTFYVTGAMGQKDDYDCIGSEARNVVHFLVSTKDGSKATVKKISEPIMSYTKVQFGDLSFREVGWNLYYVRGAYVGAADEIWELYADEKCKKSLGYRYYVTKDLTTWTPVKIKPFSEKSKEDIENLEDLVIELSGANSEYLIFKEIIYMPGPTFEPYIYTYTTDFKNYKKMTSLNKKVKSSRDCGAGAQLTFTNIGTGGRVAFLNNQKCVSSYLDRKVKNFTVLYSKGTNDFEKVFLMDGKWDYYYSMWNDRNIWCYFCDDDDAKNNCVYITDLRKGNCEKYLTKLSARKLSGIETKAEWVYSIYDGRYLLVTKNSGRTVYKIDTGKKNINRVDCAGKNLILLTDNGYDYYIPISTVQNAIKKK